MRNINTGYAFDKSVGVCSFNEIKCLRYKKDPETMMFDCETITDAEPGVNVKVTL